MSEFAKSRGKKKSTRRSMRKMLATAGMVPLAGALAWLNPVHAGTQTWSPAGPNSGGSGTWDTTSGVWYNGTILAPWNNAAGDSAYFGTPGGTVTVASPITVQDLTFAVDGYSIVGGTLTLASNQSYINVASGFTASIGSAIAGSGQIIVNNAGKLILGGTNTYSGGTKVINGGTLEVSSDSNLGASGAGLTLGDVTTGATLSITGAFNSTRAITLGSTTAAINVASGATATLGGAITGSAPLNFGGLGTTVLTAANNYSGTTTITGGILQVGGASGQLGTGATVNNGTLAFNRSTAYSYGGVISGSGAVQQIGSGGTTLSGNNTFSGPVSVSAGSLTLSGNNTYTGATTVTGGTLFVNGSANNTSGTTVASGATLQLAGTIGGNIANSGTLNLATGGTTTYSNVISGTGAVRQIGSGTSILGGANTFSGGVFINAGSLRVSNDGNLGAASNNISFTGTSSLSSTATFATSRNISIASGVTGYANTTAGTLTLNGVVSGAGAFGVNGGTVVLAGTSNTYAGTTNINVGTLQIDSEANLGAAGGGITYTGSGALRVMTTTAIARNIATNAAGNFDAYNGSAVTLNGTISGGGALNFYGGGTLGGKVVLTGTNTNTGGMAFLTGSRVEVSRDNNLGAAAGGLTFSNGTLATTASFATARNVSLTGLGTLDLAAGTTLTESGVISGAGPLTKSNTSGTLVLTGANTYSGATTIAGGTLQIGNGGASGTLGTGATSNSGTLIFNRSGSYSYGGVLSGAGTFQQIGSQTTTFTGNNTYTGATTVSAGSLYINGNQTSATGLTSMASGTTLGGSGTIGGSVTLANGATLDPGASAGTVGVLTIKGNLALSAGSILNYSFGQANTVGGTYNDRTVVGGNLTLAGSLNVAVTAGGSFDAGVYRVFDYSGTLINNGLSLGTMPGGSNATVQTSVAGQVNLINSIAGTAFWDGAANHDNNQIDGGTGTWNSGAGANSNWTDGAGAVNGAYNTGFAVFQGTPGTVTVDNSLGQVAANGLQFASNGYVINGGAITLNETTTGSGAATLRVGDGTGAGSGYTAKITAPLQGSVGVTKTDLGTLVLAGANTYSGGTTIAGGTLQLGDGTSNGSILGNVANSGTLAFDPASGTTLSYAGVVSGSGAVKYVGAGTTVLTGANTYTGGTTISSGTLQLGDGTSNGSFAGNVSNNGALVFVPAASSTITFGGIISGSGSLTQNGSGTTVLTGANTYTGGTAISAGTLQLGNGTTSGSITGNVTNNGTLAFNPSGALTYAGAISGSGAVKTLGGTTTLSGINTYTGGTYITGTLKAAGDANLGDLSGGLILNNGTLQGSFATSRNISLNGANDYMTGTMTLNGLVSGAAQLIVLGNGNVLTLNNNANTFSGGILIQDLGQLTVGSPSAIGTGALSVYASSQSQQGGILRTTATMTLDNALALNVGGNGGAR